MKSTTKLFGLIAFILMAVGFTSCDPEPDDVSKPSIVGTWTNVETEVEDGVTYTYADKLVFNANGTGYNTETVTVNSRSALSYEYRMDFLWKEETTADNIRYIEIIKTGGDDVIDSGRFTFSLISDKLNLFGVVYTKVK